MDMQGYPLWAVDARHGNTYAVVGWIHGRIPLLVHLEREVHGTYQPQDGEAFRFTTTDPSVEPQRWTMAAPDDLRECLHRLADEAERTGAAGPTVAALRQELAK